MKNDNFKSELRWFTIAEWEKEQDYLRKQHQDGWKFTNVSFPGLYHFEKCNPEDVIYQLDYNQDGTGDKEGYVKMFNDCGWEYLQNYGGYSYFRKPVSVMDGEKEEIFCDLNSRIEMMKRVLNGRVIPLVIIFDCIVARLLFFQDYSISSLGNWIYTALCILYIIILTLFGYQFWKYWKLIHK